MFVIILLVILVIIFISTNKNLFEQDNFKQIYFPYNPYNPHNPHNPYNPYNPYNSYNPEIPTTQSNYNDIISKINSQQKYKSDLYVGLSPTPIIHCAKLKNKSNCIENGCNWFSTFCSSTYPTQF